MSQAIALHAEYDHEIGCVRVTATSVTAINVKTTINQANPYGFISVPVKNIVAEVNINSSQQQTVVGYVPSIADSNFKIDEGELAIYSNTWRYFMRNNGIQYQQINTNKTAHAMMGEDTNKVIADLLKEVKSLSDKLNTFMSTTFNLHTHAITDPTKSITVTPLPIATPFIPSPDIAIDTQYIGNNENLATDSYMPRQINDG